MSTTDHTQPIEFFLEHAAEIVDQLGSGDQPIVITVGDRPRAVLVDYEKYEEYKKFQQGVALLKILNERSKQIESGETLSVGEAFRQIREKIQARKPS